MKILLIIPFIFFVNLSIAEEPIKRKTFEIPTSDISTIAVNHSQGNIDLIIKGEHYFYNVNS